MIELQMIMCAKIKQIERKAWRVQRGMTLVELLITLAIFVTVMVAVTVPDA